MNIYHSHVFTHYLHASAHILRISLLIIYRKLAYRLIHGEYGERYMAMSLTCSDVGHIFRPVTTCKLPFAIVSYLLKVTFVMSLHLLTARKGSKLCKYWNS